MTTVCIQAIEDDDDEEEAKGEKEDEEGSDATRSERGGGQTSVRTIPASERARACARGVARAALAGQVARGEGPTLPRVCIAGEGAVEEEEGGGAGVQASEGAREEVRRRP